VTYLEAVEVRQAGPLLAKCLKGTEMRRDSDLLRGIKWSEK
jgi:hypothetical protein